MSKIAYIIPITSEPNQKIRCIIPIDGKNRALILNLKYNAEAKYWHLSIKDDITKNSLITGIPLITGSSLSDNLIEQYSYLKIGSIYIIKGSSDTSDENPNNKNLGSLFKLVWSDTNAKS